MVEGSSMPHAFSKILIVGVLMLLAVFFVQNVTTSEVNFLFWSIALPRAVIYFGIFALGAAVGWMIRYFATRPR